MHTETKYHKAGDLSIFNIENTLKTHVQCIQA